VLSESDREGEMVEYDEAASGRRSSIVARR
jgi:hypothetical protein